MGIRYNKSLIRGYIRKNVSHSNHMHFNHSNVSEIISNIMKLCYKYYHIREDGIYQLTYEIYNVLNHIKQNSITMKLLIILVTKLLKLKRHPKKVTYYINEMIRLQYIEPVKLNNSSDNSKCNLYQISVQKLLLFKRTI